MPSSRWKTFIIWGTVLTMLEYIPGKQAVSLRIPDKKATQKIFELPQSRSNRRLKRRALTRNVVTNGRELVLGQANGYET